ncbi:MAG: glutathione S-transferase family protein [Hyphomicrobiales bacterium]|nr:glutathione S-transferase family protein [Hyphomicrobiales bacterium]
MSEFIVYGVPGSPFMRSVCVGMEEKGAPYRIEALAPGFMSTEAGLRLHPFGRVPAISQGEFALYETQAILRYIDAEFTGPSLQPKTPQAIGRMNQVIGVNDWYLFPLGTRVIGFQRIIGPTFMGLTPDEAAIAGAMGDTTRAFAELNRLLGDKAYFVGDALTLADIHIAPQIAFMAMTPEGRGLLQGTPLEAWLQRMNARPSMQATLPPAGLRAAA